MRTYKYQIREHPQNKRLGNLLDDLCDVHNHFLKLENRYYRRYGKYAGRFRLQPHLTKLLQRTKKHWAWIPRDTLDAVIIRLHVAWERFFNTPGTGKPKFKRKGRYRSAKFQTGYKLQDGRVRLSFKSWDESLQRLKFDKRWFSFHHHRDWHGTVRYIQILRDSVLKYKCQKHKRLLKQVGQWTTTSKPCSNCGHKNENLTLSDRQWTCPRCGSHHDRDVNAAINILRAAWGPVVETM